MNPFSLFISIVLFASALMLIVQTIAVMFRSMRVDTWLWLQHGLWVGAFSGLGTLLFLVGVGAL